jgi:ribosomal protein S12 methylthiotransferase
MADGLVLPYLDVPLQHGSPRILRAMRRPAAAEGVLERIAAWRAICPELTLRSTFIVGFPGESEDEFQVLLDFLEEARLDRVGAFTYSPVAGAAANALPDAVPEALKQERLERFMETQARISAERLAEKIGSRMTVLVDDHDEHGSIARGPGDAPEIDGVVYIEGERRAPGERVEVEITHSDEHDLWARSVDAES